MIKYALTKVIGNDNRNIFLRKILLKHFNKFSYNFVETLLNDQDPNTILGVLGLLRQLIPTCLELIWQLHFKNMLSVESESAEVDDNGYDSKQFMKIKDPLNCCLEYRQILEIYDYCLHLISSNPLSNHGIINAALEVINTILQGLNGIVQDSWDSKSNTRPHLSSILTRLIIGKDLHHEKILQNPSTLRNQILNLQNAHSDELEEEEDFEEVKDMNLWAKIETDQIDSKYIMFY